MINKDDAKKKSLESFFFAISDHTIMSESNLLNLISQYSIFDKNQSELILKFFNGISIRYVDELKMFKMKHHE